MLAVGSGIWALVAVSGAVAWRHPHSGERGRLVSAAVVSATPAGPTTDTGTPPVRRHAVVRVLPVAIAPVTSTRTS